MFRSIIIDDEEKICELIRRLGRWEEHGIEIVDCCYDGEQALDSIRRNQPDLVITDIRMPVYDGLELIRMTREMNLDTAFIIISGYRHFEYAHRAMQFGIVDYLLKPVNELELNTALAKMCASLNERRTEEHERSAFSKQQSEMQSFLHSAFLSLLTEHKPLPDTPDTCNQTYQTTFAAPFYQIVLINTSLPQLHLDNPSFHAKTDEIAHHIFDPLMHCFTIPHDQGIYLFLNYPEQAPGKLYDCFSLLYSRVSALSDFYGSFDLIIAGGTASYNYHQLQSAYNHAVLCGQASVFLGWNKVITSLPAHMKPSDIADNINFKSLVHLTDICSESGIRDWFKSLKQKLSSTSALHPADLLKIRSRLLALLEEYEYSVPELHMLSMRTWRSRNSEHFLSLFQNAVLRHIAAKLEAKEHAEQVPIEKAREYMHLHLSEPLTLETVSAVANYNPVYFSTIFKKITGHSFLDYLTRLRMEEAQRLLKQTDQTIAEIAALTGYADHKYFRKLFKKHTGIKPGDYRKLYL